MAGLSFAAETGGGLADDLDQTHQRHLVALYARALTPEEVARNWKAGPEGKTVRPE